MRVAKAEFVTSAKSIKDAPPPIRSEVAFLGRSNVGKSSTINLLTQRKNLAKSSSTPGKTQLINFFNIDYKYNNEIYPLTFVDLPGFGFAKVSKSLKREWQRDLVEFLENRESIRIFIHLVDARHFNLDIDKRVREYLESIKRKDQVIFTVFTKVDKLKQKEMAKLKKEYPDAILISNSKKRGDQQLIKKILKRIFNIES
ncbi:MAG: YihA family ribosome biogenesis GTP-binding protein [Epsilonproteobacteria bacterium]|nr:YihA family ribosome biogenesis GTP-binding protein [Campylobacterota bacterium]